MNKLLTNSFSLLIFSLLSYALAVLGLVLSGLLVLQPTFASTRRAENAVVLGSRDAEALYYLAKFVRWSPEFESNSQFNLCFLEEAQINREKQGNWGKQGDRENELGVGSQAGLRALGGRSVRGREIKVLQLKSLAEAARCQMLYLEGVPLEKQQLLKDLVVREKILTVMVAGKQERGATQMDGSVALEESEAGVLVSLEQRMPHLRVNGKLLRETGLSVSAELWQLLEVN